jgi:steroid 5-alpha reductase family enzyme
MGRDGRRRGATPSADWTRANLAIAVGWAALAVVFGAYAIVRDSAGAGLLALVVIWCMRLAWVAAWRGEDDQEGS